MLDNNYLCYGLNALSRAYQSDYFRDGHRGGAIISGLCLCRENIVETEVPAIIACVIDDLWANTQLCAPFPEEPAEPQLLNQLVACIADHSAGMRQAGHNIILPTLALKAFHDLPDAITPARIDGICRLVAAMTVMDVPDDEPVYLPDLQDPVAAAHFILSEFVDGVARFTGRGQGWSGHLLTYGKALLDLHELGYHDLARQAEAGFALYIRRLRLGPQETDKPRAEHEPMTLAPLQATYWHERTGDLTFGHQLKYPYGFYGLLRHVTDEGLHQRCLELCYRIF